MASGSIKRRFPPNGWRNSRPPRAAHCGSDLNTLSFALTSQSWTTPIFARSPRPRNTANGAKTIYPHGSVMAAFEYRQAEEIRDCFARHGVKYLFLGKSGAILLGFPDTTQDADVFVDRDETNGLALVAALVDL